MAKFNFDAAVEMAMASMRQTVMEAIILGPSGAGKSYILGSFGVPTLYIYSTGESHGPKAAEKCVRDLQTGSTILPFCMDIDESGKKLEGDAVIARVMDVLFDEPTFTKYGIKAIAVDGAAELENYIRASNTWKLECRTKGGDHNSYAEPTATCNGFRPIFNRLKELQRTRDVHFAMTCMLDVKEYGDMNDVADAVPRLKGFSVAEMLVQQFGDVLVVGPMVRDDETKWKFQFMTDLSKTSKDLKGVVKRTVNFRPRLNGVTPPPYVDADLRKLIALKEQG
jgi:hypothetical protein